MADLKEKLTFCTDSLYELNSLNKKLNADKETLQDSVEKGVKQISLLEAERGALADTITADISKAI